MDRSAVPMGHSAWRLHPVLVAGPATCLGPLKIEGPDITINSPLRFATTDGLAGDVAAGEMPALWFRNSDMVIEGSNALPQSKTET
jgi:hypothetical protein